MMKGAGIIAFVAMAFLGCRDQLPQEPREPVRVPGTIVYSTAQRIGGE